MPATRQNIAVQISATARRSNRGDWLGVLALSLAVASTAVSCGGRSPAQLASESLNKGLEAHNAGNLEEAARLYRECLSYEPTNKICLYDLGFIAQTQGRPAEAENYYRLSLSTDPNYGPAVFNLAVLRVSLGDNVSARELYRHYVALFPDEASGHLNLGLVLRALGDEEGALAQLAEALRLDPTIQVPQPSLSPAVSPASSPAASPTP